MTGDRLSPADVHTPGQRAGGIRVDSYEGLTAGAAIGEVRSVGLHPHPQRVEGYQSDVHGQVVGQEPAAGELLQAGGIVELLIAAPTRETPTAGGPPPEVEPPLHETASDQAEAVTQVEVECCSHPEDEQASKPETVEQPRVTPPEESPPAVTGTGGHAWIDELPPQRARHRDGSEERGRARRPARRRSRSWWRALPLFVRVTAAALIGCVLLALAVSVAEPSTPPRRPIVSQANRRHRLPRARAGEPGSPRRAADHGVRQGTAAHAKAAAHRAAHRERPAAPSRPTASAAAAPATPQAPAPDVDQQPGTTSTATPPPPPPAEAAPPITPAERMEIEFGVR